MVERKRMRPRVVNKRMRQRPLPRVRNLLSSRSKDDRQHIYQVIKGQLKSLNFGKIGYGSSWGKVYKVRKIRYRDEVAFQVISIID